MSQTGGHTMLQQPAVAQHVNVNYAPTNVPNNTSVGFPSTHHGGLGGSDGGIVGTNESPHGLHNLPPTMSGNSSTSSSWTTKSPPLQQVQQGNHPSQSGMMNSPGDVHHHQHHLRSANNSSYGAPFNNNHFQQSQHCLYSQQQHNMELRYDSSGSNGSSSIMRPNSASDYSPSVEMTNANAYYHHHDGDDRVSVSGDCRQHQYYGNSMDQHGFPSYDHHSSHHHHPGNDLKNTSGNVVGTTNGGSSSCAMMNSGGNSVGGHNTFYHHNYGYSNQNSQHYHHVHEMYSGGGGNDHASSNSPDDFVSNSSRTLSTVTGGGGSAMNNLNRYFDGSHHHSQRPDGSYNMYNSSSCGYSNSNNNGSSCSTNGRYGGMMSSSTTVPAPHYNTSQIVHGHHHHHPPFRRKSMESYISEPGEMRYNNKYGCISSSSSSSPSSFPAQQPQQQYISPSPSPSSTTMVKRECLSNPSSSALPVMPNGSSPDCSPWNARATPTSNDIEMHDQHPQHHDSSPYLYPDQSGSTMAMTDLEYGSGSSSGPIPPYGNGPTTPGSGNDPTTFHHNQSSHHHLSTFKSCAFGNDCNKLDGDLKDSSLGYGGVKAGSVKHRSLSLSMPSSSSSPSPYPGMGQMPSSSQTNFPNNNESHMKSHVESHRSDNSPNSSSCCNPLEKVGSGESHIMSSSSYDCGLESSSTNSMDHQQHYVTSYGEGSIGGGGVSNSETVGSLHVQASYNSQQQNGNTRDDCCSVVTSCSGSEQVHNDESNQHNHSHHHNHHHNPTDCYLQSSSNGNNGSGSGESLEKVYSGGMMGNDGNESGSSTTNSSIAGSPTHSNSTSNTNNNDLCSSTPSHMCDERMGDGTPNNNIGGTNSSSSLMPQSPEFGRDLSESDLVIVEKSFENDEDDDPPDPEDLMLDDDDDEEEDCEEDDEVEDDSKTVPPSSDSNAISTTTNDLSRYCRNDEECDESNSNSSTGSNCSFSSALFGIKRANHTNNNNNHGSSVSCNFNSDDNESCGSGGSLTFGSIGRSDSFSSTHHHNSPGSSGSGHCGSKLSSSPQKISKRSFSETDKDLVINATSLSFGSLMAMGGHDRKMNHPRVSHKTGCGSGNNNNQLLGVDGGVSVPKGWKREIFQANENHLTVFYVSPSDTKLRSWEELKNYICSDGTCKCGLSCPLRLESAFSFDPKVISVCIEKTEDQEDNHLRYSSSGEVEESHHNHQKQISKHQKESPTSPSLCNHHSSSANVASPTTATTTTTSSTTKRKIPKSEDSPLISSTRDDLGDCSTEKGAKKRRTSESESLQFCGGNPGNATPLSTESPGGSSSSSSSGSGGVPSSSAIRSHVAVPCSQQSPDTTTQTPQTEMSPASSISSEPSSCGSNNLLLHSGGSSSSSSSSSSNRSLRSTPTPPSSSNGKVSTPPSSKRQQQQQGDFIWPPPPSSSTSTPGTSSTQMQLLSSPNANNNNNNGASLCWTSPTTTTTSNSGVSQLGTSNNNNAATNQSQQKNKVSSGCHHLMPKPSGGPIIKRVSSPCPNVDVRQIPPEQNQPPPKQPPSSSSVTSLPLISPVHQQQTTPVSVVLTSTSSTTNLNDHTNNNNNANQHQQQLPQRILQQQQQSIINQPQHQQFLLPTSSQAGISCSIPTLQTSNVTTTLGGNFGLNTNANISFFPVTSTHNDMTNISMNLNSGFTISPIIQQTPGGMRILNQPQISHQVLSSTNVPCSMPMQIQKVFTGIPEYTGGSGQTTFISGFQPPMVLSVLPQQQPQLQEITPATVEAKVEDASSKPKETNGANQSSDSAAEKSPLQLVQDVVDRFDSKTGGSENGNKQESSESNSKKESAGSITSSSSTNDKPEDGSDGRSTKDSKSVAPESDSKKADETKKQEGETNSDGVEKKTSTSSENCTIGNSGEPKVKTEADNKTDLTLSDEKDSGCDEVTIISEGTNNKTEVVSSATSSVNTSTVTLAPMDQSTCVTTCVTNIGGPGGPLGTFTLQNPSLMNTGQGQQGQQQQIILQSQGSDGTGGAGQNFISAAGPQSTMRYPIIQTIQPFFLNPTGNGGGPLIISPSQSHQTQGDPNAPQSFIYHQDPNQSQQIGQATSNNPGDPSGAGGGVAGGVGGGIPQTMIQPQTTTMLFDPSSLCANNPNLLGALAAASGGPKKKKKRLSKKQQQQQAQLQLQQQLLLQQIQQQQAAAAFPLTIFPQSFNLGPQGFSLQPMNFFQTPTILTLPNLILNPADGTLFIQPSAPLSTTTSMPQQTVKFPLGATTTTISPQPQQQQHQQMQQQPHQNLIAPKKDTSSVTQQQQPGGITILGTTPGQGQILEVGKPLSDPGSDDSRRNPTPDSSTGDVQLGILNAQGQHQQGNTIISIAPHPTTTTQLISANPSNKKISIKSRAVSSSSTVKRILPQKQILPKIDSTTPTIENN